MIAECLVSGVKEENGDTIITAEIFPNAEKVQEILGEVALDSEQVRQKIDEIIREINHSLATYKYIRRFELRDTEFEMTTSRKIKRQY